MLPEQELLAMTPAQWQAYIDAHARKEARERAWEARLHGLRHKSGRALSAEDFLPRSAKPCPGTPEGVFAQFAAAFAPIQKNKAPAAPTP